MKNPTTLFTPRHHVATQKNAVFLQQQGDKTCAFLLQIFGLTAGS